MPQNLDQARAALELAKEMYAKAQFRYQECSTRLDEATWEVYRLEQIETNTKYMEREATERYARRALVERGKV